MFWHEKQNVTVKRKHLLNLKKKKKTTTTGIHFVCHLRREQDEVENRWRKKNPTNCESNKQWQICLAPTQQNASVNIKYLYKRNEWKKKQKCKRNWEHFGNLPIFGEFQFKQWTTRGLIFFFGVSVSRLKHGPNHEYTIDHRVRDKKENIILFFLNIHNLSNGFRFAVMMWRG